MQSDVLSPLISRCCRGGNCRRVVSTYFGSFCGHFFRAFGKWLGCSDIELLLLNGKEVVIKIQRPHFHRNYQEDLELLIDLSRRIPKAMLPMVNLSEVLQQLKDSLTKEIDFRNEAQAMITFAELNQSIKCIAIPEVFDEYTTPRMVVEEYISGIPINHYEELIKAHYDLEDIGKKLMLSFIKQVFKDGYFHGDPHPGNL